MTEKEYAPNKKEKKITEKVDTPKQEIKTPVQKKTESKETTKPEEQKQPEEKESPKKNSEKKTEKKQSPEKPKKDYVVINGKSLNISTKDSSGICKFIKKKRIDKAISDLEDVLRMKKSIPMKGEIPHRKGKIMSGRYPINATKEFIVLLNSLKANSIDNGLEEPWISEAVPNQASKPVGKFGRWERKRTHIFIKAINKPTKKQGEKK